MRNLRKSLRTSVCRRRIKNKLGLSHRYQKSARVSQRESRSGGTCVFVPFAHRGKDTDKKQRSTTSRTVHTILDISVQRRMGAVGCRSPPLLPVTVS